MGISKKDIERFNELDLKAYDMFNKGMSITSISKELGVKRHSLSKRLKEKYDIDIILDNKKSIDDNFFCSIDTKEKAYWLGFMYADGYVSEDRNTIDLCLKESDKQHVEKFKNALNSNHKISKKKNLINGKEFISYRISIRSKEMNNDLKKHGCINNKSLTCNFPDIDKVFISDFIRGFFDGDGCIHFDNRYKNKHPRIELSCGSYNFITSLKDILEQNYGLKSNLYNDRNIYSLRIYKQNDVSTFLDILYNNSSHETRLDRKYNLYTFCRLEPKLQETQED